MDSPVSIALQIFVHFALLSLMAVGGGVLALAPEMMRYVSETHAWISAADFVECFTLAQIAPGPNFLFATLVGERAAGLAGAVAATVALIVPPALLTLATLHFGAKRLDSPLGARLRVAILPLSIGMVAASSWSLAAMSLGSLAQGAAFAIATALLFLTRLNPLWLIALGGVLSMLHVL